MFCDPGSQIVSAGRNIAAATQRLGVDHGMEWVVGTPDSPWRQGAVEALVKSAKRAIKFAIGNNRISVPEFLTVCTEAANLINERPLGLLPSIDSDINVLTPNCLLLGRACADNPGGWSETDESVRRRCDLVADISHQFWNKWIELFAPSLVFQNKWFETKPDLAIGDIVLVLDTNVLKGSYRLAKVTEVHPSQDGKVRTVSITYKRYKTGESVKEYKGASDITVKRSIQRLIPLVQISHL